MTKLRNLTLATLLATAVAAGPALAQSAAKPKPKAKEDPAMSVLVENKRTVGLIELAVVSKGQIYTVATNVESGKNANAKVPSKAGCVVDIDGMFEDGTTVEVAKVNICKDKRITLVE
jgi:hypothetical protein